MHHVGADRSVKLRRGQRCLEVPLPVAGMLPRERLVDMQIRGAHAAAVSSRGRLFTWSSDAYGQLFRDTTHNVNGTGPFSGCT